MSFAALELLDRMLVLDLDGRITVEEALQVPWLKSVEPDKYSLLLNVLQIPYFKCIVLFITDYRVLSYRIGKIVMNCGTRNFVVFVCVLFWVEFYVIETFENILYWGKEINYD